jgi:hypothetical protein
MTAVLRKGTVIENPEAHFKRSIRNGIDQADSIEDRTESTHKESLFSDSGKIRIPVKRLLLSLIR